jgi:hypothetical protein
MRPLLAMAAGMAVWVAAGAAQDNPEQLKKMAAMKAQAADLDQMLRGAKVIGIEAGIMGPAVKGEPYSAEEIRETNQVLADGTKIHNETKTTVYRDSMGRVRRESPGQIMIWDSAAGTSYVLNQSNQTGHKMLMNYMVRKVAPGDPLPDPVAMPDFRFDTAVGGSALAQHTIILKTPDAQGLAEGKAQLRDGAKKETLPGQMLEGVNCEGSRITNTIEAGAIGNDRAIQTVEERWYSPELQVNLLVRKTDPRTGEDTVRLTNVRRLEPDATLFVVPSGYQMK